MSWGRLENVFAKRWDVVKTSSQDVLNTCKRPLPKTSSCVELKTFWRCFEGISFLLYEGMSQLLRNFMLDLGNANFTIGTPCMVPKGPWEIPLTRLEIKWWPHQSPNWFLDCRGSACLMKTLRRYLLTLSDHRLCSLDKFSLADFTLFFNSNGEVSLFKRGVNGVGWLFVSSCLHRLIQNCLECT